jgi:hypothetical protein
MQSTSLLARSFKETAMPPETNFESVKAKEIVAQTIKLAGSDGATRIMLHAGEDGGAVACLYDLGGAIRINLSIDANGTPAIVLFDREGAMRASIYQHGDQAAISVHDEGGSPRAQLACASGVPLVWTMGPDGAPAAKL